MDEQSERGALVATGVFTVVRLVETALDSGVREGGLK